jgi:hypothetical protein
MLAAEVGDRVNGEAEFEAGLDTGYGESFTGDKGRAEEDRGGCATTDAGRLIGNLEEVDTTEPVVVVGGGPGLGEAGRSGWPFA